MSLNAVYPHKNNFDFLRLLFSSLVIVSHSFPLTGKAEWFSEITYNQISLGSLSVECFFVMSGYMIFQSLDRSSSVWNYLWKRIIRIFPALIVLLLVTLCILPFFYQGNIFKEPSYYSYFYNCLSLYNVQYIVVGIFEHLPYPNAINGSLWSLSYEFTMYLALLFFFIIKNRTARIVLLISSFCLAYGLVFKEFGIFADIFRLVKLNALLLYKMAMFFFAGAILSQFDLNKFKRLSIVVLLLVLTIVAVYFRIYNYIAPILVPLVIILFGSLKTKYISEINAKFGDISYGVYIYGFLVQQLLMQMFHLDTIPLMIGSLLVTFVLGKLSWDGVEKKIMKFKNVVK